MTGLLGRSFLAAAVIVGLALLRALLLHRLPKFTFQAAWAVVILRLLIPFSVPVFDAPDGGGVSRITDFLAGGLRERAEGSSSPGFGIAGEVDAGRSLGALFRADSRGMGNSPEEGFGQGSGIISGRDSESLPDREGSRKTKQDQRDEDVVSETSGEKASRTVAENSEAMSVAAGNAKNGTGRAAVFYGIWFAGALAVLLSFTVSHLRARRLYSTALPVSRPLPETELFRKTGLLFRVSQSLFRALGKSVRRKVAVKVSDRIFAPVTYGVLSPVILLPKNTDWGNTEQLRMVLGHETVHIRRFDILYKWLLAAALALHWFNPFVFLMYVLANRDIELSCDEAVIRCLSGRGKKDYALALLSFEEKRMFSPTVSGFGGNAVRERMEAIMKTNKKSVMGMAMAAILVAGTTTVFAGTKDAKKALPDGQQQSVSGTQADGPDNDTENPDPQEAAGGNTTKQTPDLPVMNGQDPGGMGQNEKAGEENGSGHTKRTVKQYICEPAYYTPEEFKESLEQEREELRKEVAAGSITQDGADEILAELVKKYEDVKNGRQIEKPSPVYNADGTPVVGSDGCQLYAKASDIERMNKDLRETADWLENVTSIDEYDTQVELKFIQGELFGGIPDDFKLPETDISWYDYEEYREYVEKMKEEYRSMKGEWGFNLTDGWFEWDDEKIEIACQLLDQNLEFQKWRHDFQAG